MWYRSYGLLLVVIAILVATQQFRNNDVAAMVVAGLILLIDLPLRWIGNVVPWCEYRVANWPFSVYRGSQVYSIPTWIFGALAMLVGLGLFAAHRFQARAGQGGPPIVAEAGGQPAPKGANPPEQRPPQPPGKKTLTKNDLDIKIDRQPRSYTLSVLNKLPHDLNEMGISVSMFKGGQNAYGWFWPPWPLKAGAARTTDQGHRWDFDSIRIHGSGTAPDGTVCEFDLTWAIDG
jgi:hypothetical protein